MRLRVGLAFLLLLLLCSNRVYSQCNAAVSVTSTGTFTGGSTGTNYDKLADALQGSNPGAGVCNGGTVFVYIDTNDNPALDKNITIQGVGNVSWTYSSGALIQPAESTGITIANMAVSQGGSFALLTTSGNASGSLVFIQDTITEGSGVPALINFGSGNNPPLQPIGKIYFMQSVLMGNGSNSVGLDIGNNTTNEGGFLFENSIMCGFSEAVSTTVALPTGYLTFLNSDLANNSSDALYSSVASNNIAVTNTAFIGNGVDNSGFSQAGFDFDAFGTDSTGGYANSIVISSSDFLNSGGSCAAASSNNLQESATSKLFSAGTNLYAAGVQNDILGNPRPVSGSFDIGAYQTVVANTATPTATSTNTPTNTPTTTATTTPTNTSTSTPTITSTNTSAATNTPTVTFTATMTSTFTFTPTSTVTATPTCITHIWPDPYNPKEAFNGKLFISCMSPGTFVMIYTVSGELVKTLNSTNGGICSLTGISGTTYCWDGRNELKTQVASGIYFYVIQQGDQITQKGKFLLVNEN